MTRTIQSTEKTCTEQCSGMCLDLRCSEMTYKSCSSCALGYKGKLCQERCPSGCLDGCHAESGLCLNCPAGSYGPECQFTCPQNCLDGKCSNSSGTCETCAVGYRGKDCEEKCPQGFYGNSCGTLCAKTCKGGYCNAVTGHCLEGCKPGYFGIYCDRACPAKTYGQNCLSNCPATCAEGLPCKHETGECVSGCLSGFWGAYCNKTCPANKYGTNCNFNCSQACFHSLCNAFSGTCLTCEEPFYGSLCQYKIDINGIQQGALDTEVSPYEAVLMIGGIVLVGVLMWIGVAYLLLHQRKRILRDAAKGVDPRTLQWGMFPNNQGFKRAVKLYDKKWARVGGGDAEISSNKKLRNEKKTKPYLEYKRQKMMFKANKKLWWWTNPRGEKLIPPDEEDLERVEKWLERYHGTEHLTKDQASKTSKFEQAYYKNETRDSSGKFNPDDDVEDDTKITGQNKSSWSFNQETVKTMALPSTEFIASQGQQEKLHWPSEDPIGQEGTSLAIGTRETSTLISHTMVDQSIHQAKIQQSIGRFLSNDSMPIRKDTIYLHPEPRSKCQDIRMVPKCLRETSRVKWIRDRMYRSSEIQKPNSKTTIENITSTSTSATISNPDSTVSSSSSTSSGSSTVTYTNTSWRTNNQESVYTSSEESTYSSSSEDVGETSEGSSVSTMVTSQKDQNAVGDIPPFFETGLGANAKPYMKNIREETTSNERDPPGLLQRFYRMFRRKKKNSEQEKSYPDQTTVRSIPGAGGLLRPFSNKFLINRLETWERNRGMEVNINDGMMEVTSTKSKRINQDLRRTGPSKKISMDNDSSWVTTDLSDKYNKRYYSTSKQSIGTSEEDLTDVPSAMVTDTVKDGETTIKHV
ncbi:hypothetical protein RRG08_054592 [Elysia crispata]|uniref:EGF-like domain-containing protein n=1 Tax=Elysia crispata TaxID=231223 RepID=A0AAE1E7T4_9GAST|nr:hypothetical protein RRG08_054592 [Elysia crispata]